MSEERSTVEILRAARERITPEENWTTRDYARDRSGCCVEPNAESACRWCAIGSLLAEEGLDSEGDRSAYQSRRPTLDALVEAARSFPETSISFVNDREGHDAALAMYDRAIQLAEAEASA